MSLKQSDVVWNFLSAVFYEFVKSNVGQDVLYKSNINSADGE